MEKSLQKANQEQIKHEERTQAMTQQIETARAENARLHQLVTNIQKNLEHYQEKMHKHQMDLALQAEKQQGFYLQEIMELKQQLAYEKNQAKPLKLARNQLQETLIQVEKQHQQLQLKHEAIQQQHQDAIHEKTVLSDREAAAKQMVSSMKAEHRTITKQLHQQEMKAAVLLDQNAYLKKELSNTQDKVEALRQKNLFLTQEKAQLEGYLNKVKLIEKTKS